MDRPCETCVHPCYGIRFLFCPEWCDWAAKFNGVAETAPEEEDESCDT